MRNDIEEFKELMLEIPDNFVTYYDIGEDDWGFTPFTVHRDSDILENSNWEKITEDLMEEFPDSFEINHCTHWAVGWLDHLMCKMTDEKAIERVFEIYEGLQDYCVYDDSDFSEKEWEAEQEYIDDYIFPEVIKKIEEEPWEYYNLTGIIEDEYWKLNEEPKWYYELPEETKDLIKSIVEEHTENYGNDEWGLYHEDKMWIEISRIQVDFPEKGEYYIEDSNQLKLDLNLSNSDNSEEM